MQKYKDVNYTGHDVILHLFLIEPTIKDNIKEEEVNMSSLDKKVLRSTNDNNLLVVTTSVDDTLWKLQFANSFWNGTGHTFANMTDAVAAGFYTTAVVNFETRKTNTVSLDFQGGRMNVGSKVWCRCLNDDNTESTISIMIGIHAYLV